MITFSSDLFTGQSSVFYGPQIVAYYSGSPECWAVSRSLIPGRLAQLVGVKFSSREALHNAIEAALKINPPNQGAANSDQLSLF